MSPGACKSRPELTLAWAAASLFAVDPVGLGGIAVRSDADPTRDEWLARVRALLPRRTPERRIPPGIGDGPLLGGLDLAATLTARRRITQRGLLAQANGGIVILPMAERLTAASAARITAALDSGSVALERDGCERRDVARFGVVALDEGVGADERPPESLLDRIGLRVDLHRSVGAHPRPDAADASNAGDRSRTAATGNGLELETAVAHCAGCSAAAVAAARRILHLVRVADEILEALCETAVALGIDSLRAPTLALAAARAAAALLEQPEVGRREAGLAAMLVLAPRARRLPAPAESATNAVPEEPDRGQQPPEGQEEPTAGEPAQRAPEQDPSARAEALDESMSGADSQPEDADPAAGQPAPGLGEITLEAARAVLPPGLIAELTPSPQRSADTVRAGRARAAASRSRGRPSGTGRGDPRSGARLNVLETLRAAAPWQTLRRSSAPRHTPGHARQAPLIEVRRDDFRICRFKQRTRVTTVFVVDASGSTALHRLAEVKGAIELMLAECYVRRDQVALVTFRGREAQLLLPPTRSLVRAKRCLSSLPGGGGTPLASGIDAAYGLVELVRRRGEMPVVVVMTDGRANVGRDGKGNRERAEADALSAARSIRAAGLCALVIDTAPQPRELAARLAREMAARYLPLPHANAGAVSQAVRRASAR